MKEKGLEDSGNHKKRLGFFVGLIGFFAIILMTELGIFSFSYGNSGGSHHLVGRMLATTWLMATWWMTEALPIPVTSLLPLVLLPFMGILPGKATARQYANEIIFLFMGGFFLALALQKWNLHRRIALLVVSFLGGRASRMVLGFMVASAFLSMWISNTATTMMLLPIGLSVLAIFEEDDPKVGREIGTLLMLGIAYAASVGGIATLVGTPPNLSFARIFQIYFPQAPEITFVSWLKIGLPVTLVMLPTIWIVLVFFFFRKAVKKTEGAHAEAVEEVFRQKLHELGPMKWQEWTVLSIFILTAALWLFRSDIRLGDQFRIKGWTTLLNLKITKKRTIYVPLNRWLQKTVQKKHQSIDFATFKKLVDKRLFHKAKGRHFIPLSIRDSSIAKLWKERHLSQNKKKFSKIFIKEIKLIKKTAFGDGVIAIMMALLLFMIPADSKGERLMDWETAAKIPWGMLLLFGGGFALAAGIKGSGMSAWVGEMFRWKGFAHLGAFGVIAVITLVITFLTEFTSNTATTEIMLAIMAPVVATFGGTGVHPFLLMIPTTIAASCAFMMPVATPPNAIAYASGYIPMEKMVKVGIVLNILSVILISTLLYFLMSYLGIPLLHKPLWVN